MLDDKDRKILEFIQGYTQAEGYPPTLEEIGYSMGTVKSSIYYRVKKMVRDGFIERGPAFCGRTLKVVKYDG